VISRVALLWVLAVSPVLDAAKKHLARGQFDEIAFDFEGQKVPEAEKPEAARVLAQASKLALDAKDSVVALHCAQKALRLAPRDAKALEAGARAAFAQQQFADAEAYADGWILADEKSPAPHLLRAELASEAGEWDRVLEELKGRKFEGADAAKAGALENKAQTEKAAGQTGLSEMSSLQVAAAAAQRAVANLPASAAVARREDVIVYSTSWCGYCRKTRAWLDQRHVPYVDKDIEQDEGAARELARKAVEQHMVPRGVPVIDARGTLINGYDPEALERALHP
jgi:glutaredoxin